MGAVSDETGALRTATARHYETFPFVEGGPRRVARWRRRLAPFVPDPKATTVDVGCGSGEAAESLRMTGGTVVCIDLTWAAVQRVRARTPVLQSCRADALALPLADRSVDQAIAMGVLHHTPDAQRGLEELMRIARQRVVVMVYARHTPYRLLYWLTRPLRRSVPVEVLRAVPDWVVWPIQALMSLQVVRWVNANDARTLLADQYWTPTVTFHSEHEITAWANQGGFELVEHRRVPLQGHVLAYERGSW